MAAWANGAWASGALASGSWSGESGFVPGTCWAPGTWIPSWAEFAWETADQNVGQLQVSAQTLSAVGVIRKTGTGALSAQKSQVAGAATVDQAIQPVTGTGGPTANSEFLEGVGYRTSHDLPGDIALFAQTPVVAGVAVRRVSGSGALEQGRPSAVGNGNVNTGGGGKTGSGTPVCSDSFLTVTGSVGRKAPTVTLAVSAATMAGTGKIGKVGSGALVAADSTLSGSGALGGETGVGALSATKSTLAGTGIRRLRGSGDLSANLPTISGVSVRRITGSGALVGQKIRLRGYDPELLTGGDTTLRPLSDTPVRRSPRPSARRIR